MTDPTKHALATLFYFLSGIISIVIIIFVDARISMSTTYAWTIGLVVLIAGLSLAAWGISCLGFAIFAEVEPKLNHLVRRGPYQYVRHPIYLAAITCGVGMSTIMRSWLGLLAVIVLVIPSAVFRATLEDNALRARFKNEWEDYASHTGFLWPRFR